MYQFANLRFMLKRHFVHTLLFVLMFNLIGQMFVIHKPEVQAYSFDRNNPPQMAIKVNGNVALPNGGFNFLEGTAAYRLTAELTQTDLNQYVRWEWKSSNDTIMKVDSSGLIISTTPSFGRTAVQITATAKDINTGSPVTSDFIWVGVDLINFSLPEIMNGSNKVVANTYVSNTTTFTAKVDYTLPQYFITNPPNPPIDDSVLKSVTWSSTNPGIATIDATTGVITPKANGSTYIMAKIKARPSTATSVLIYVSYKSVTSVGLDKTSLNLNPNSQYQLNATVLPNDASNKKVTWSSDNTSVASVDPISGLVTAKAQGTANITVTTEDGKKTATSKITVTSTVTVPVTTSVDSVTLDKSQVNLNPTQTAQLTATVKPDTASNKKLTWKSSNETVATVNSTGLVTAFSNGTATITVTTEDGNKTATATVTVTTPTSINNGPISGGNLNPLPSTTANARVTLNGTQREDLHTDKQNSDGIEATINGTLLLDAVNKIPAGQNIVLRIESIKSTDKLNVYIDAQTFQALQAKKVVIETSTQGAIYQVPTHRLNVEASRTKFESNVAAKDILVQLVIQPSSSNVLSMWNSQVAQRSASNVINPVSFSVTLNYKGQVANLVETAPYAYISKWIPTTLTSAQYATAMRIDSTGVLMHVPTKQVAQDGKTYIVIQGLEASGDYGVIANSKNFSDITKHWAKNYILDGGSRAIIDGVGDNRFEADRSVTRAEFATMLIRGLGIQPTSTIKSYKDVKSTDWFNPYVQTASAYSLINGYEDNSFKPSQTITREEAMAMLARAMRLIDYASQVSSNEGSLAGFKDSASVSSWATEDAVLNLKAKTIQGDANKNIRPKAPISRAETATVIIRLLNEASLIEFKR